MNVANASDIRNLKTENGATKSQTTHNIFLQSAPKGLEKEFRILLSPDAIEFLANLTLEFEDKIADLYNRRLGRKYELKTVRKIPNFVESTITNSDWSIAPIPEKLYNRHLDLGDVSPANIDHFTSALCANVQGVQVDFDDGHCPTWRNQILGLFNVYQATRGRLSGAPPISDAPIFMLRPRAWNMIEHNMTVNGREIPGPLFDFGLLIFHNGQILSKYKVGPCFYLSKLEGANEARLWNEIFVWSQSILRIPNGTIKACVLIENVLSSFEMDDILYELKDHSLGLNCGIWDYCASIISKFGGNKFFLLPDRKKYVDMNKHFLKRYMQLVIQTCHKRGAHATGGMAAELLPSETNNKEYIAVIEKVCKAKLMEIETGIDGFMVYDVKLVPHINKLWKEHGGLFPNQIKCHRWFPKVLEIDLLTLPRGGVTRTGLLHNISVAMLFIFNWLNGKGHFAYKGSIEDSATAEISRAQIWQWIRHGVQLEDDTEIVTRQLVVECACGILEIFQTQKCKNKEEREQMSIAFDLFLELVTYRESPEFITTYLNDIHVFRKIHAGL